MHRDLDRRLAELGADFESVAGRKWTHFHCPILHRDIPGDISRGHIINQAFPGAPKDWVPQRSDVESFFGSLFEADYTLLKEKGRTSAADALADPHLAHHLNASVLLGDKRVGHYYPKGPVPRHHTEVSLMRDGLPDVRVALKIAPDDVVESKDAQWGLQIQRDVRVAALASLLKAAHLTLFRLGGYRYALSLGGHFLGRTILGEFAEKWMAAPRRDALTAAKEHFGKYSNLVRPIVETPEGLSGTVSDNYLYLCTGTPVGWAMMVAVKAGHTLHGVLCPIMDDPESAARFLRFLDRDDGRFEVKLMQWQEKQWAIARCRF